MVVFVGSLILLTAIHETLLRIVLIAGLSGGCVVELIKLVRHFPGKLKRASVPEEAPNATDTATATNSHGIKRQ
jgi:hypothetical protein